MAQYTPQQIAQFAYNAGFRGAALNQAVAIALAESGGRNDAYNPEAAAGTAQGSGSRGLWQIYGTAHPEYNNSQAFDPQVNANAAYKVFMEAGRSFRPWSTYNAGVRASTDYAAMIRGAKKQAARSLGKAGSSQNPSPVKTMAAGVSGWQQLAALPMAQSSINTEPAPKGGDVVNLPIGISFKKSDAAFIFFGSGFIVMGVLFLLLAGVAGVAAVTTPTGQALTKAAVSLSK